MYKQLVIGSSLLYLTSIYGQHIAEPNCRNGDIVTYHRNDIPKKFDTMMKAYNETCTSEMCKLEPDENLIGLLQWEYGGSNFALERACESWRNPGYKLCSVQTVAYHTFERGGVDIDGYIIEQEKPICFPPSCSDDQITILDPTPGRCSPGSMNCQIVNYNVNCPNRQVSNTQNCARDKLSDTHAFNLAKGATEIAVVADCTAMFSGQGSLGLCKASTGPVDSETFSDFTGFETHAAYIDHENECIAEGGQVCHFDMVADFAIPEDGLKQAFDDVIPLESSGKVTARHTFTNFPRCISTKCGRQSMEEVLETHANMFLGKLGLRCDIESDDCTINIENVSCPNFSPRAAESVFAPETKSPTPLPTPNPTQNPTPPPSPNPTQNPTPPPTPNPTRNPTPPPTPNPTSEPTNLDNQSINTTSPSPTRF